MAKKQKTTRFSIQSYDLAHYRTTEGYAQAVQSLYDKATTAISRAAVRGNIDPDKPFTFDMYPSVKKEMQRVMEQLASRMQAVIETGSRKQWLFACQKNDGFLASIMDTSKLSKARLMKMQDQNLDALAAFQGRKVEGMDLSQRIWKYVGQYKDQLESALDVGLGEGRSADELSRDVRHNLLDPNRLFRRVRDKRGNLVLSKRAAAFHPGRGVYRSSYKNAMRLTRSEINMAYRESDWKRWQALDFVVGFEIHRSNHEPLCECEICEKLVGRYPKTFKFKGWHPQCMCYATPILMDEATFDENELGDLKAALKGTTYKRLQAKNVVSDVPDGFKEWVDAHIEAQKGWASTPYFIRDNFVDGQLGKGLKIAMPTVNVDVLAAYLTQIAQAREMATKWGLTVQLNMLDLHVQKKDIAGLQSIIATIQQKASIMEQADADIRSKCAKWGVGTSILDQAMSTHDSKQILKAQADLDDQCIMAEKEYTSYVDEARKAIQEAKSSKVDASDVEGDVDNVTSNVHDWLRGKLNFKKRLSDLLKAIQQSSNTNISIIPNDLRRGSMYLNGENYTFDPDFFGLCDPKRTIKLTIHQSDSGSYSSWYGDEVVIASKNRNLHSPWHTKSVIYHEYGHCIDAQRDLWKDSKLTDMRSNQIKRLRSKTNAQLFVREWDYDQHKWVYKKRSFPSKVAYIDMRLRNLREKIGSMNEETFTKRGIKKKDVMEQIVSTLDTIKSLVTKYGDGHSTSYFSRIRMKETEYLAHAFENAFLGNRVFQKYMPDIYAEMVAYIKALKPM